MSAVQVSLKFLNIGDFLAVGPCLDPDSPGDLCDRGRIWSGDPFRWAGLLELRPETSGLQGVRISGNHTVPKSGNIIDNQKFYTLYSLRLF
jgi:hypothetical protein